MAIQLSDLYRRLRAHSLMDENSWHLLQAYPNKVAAQAIASVTSFTKAS